MIELSYRHTADTVTDPLTLWSSAFSPSAFFVVRGGGGGGGSVDGSSREVASSLCVWSGVWGNFLELLAEIILLSSSVSSCLASSDFSP